MTATDTQTDGFGNFFPLKCPDCGADVWIMRPGEAVCSEGCGDDPPEDNDVRLDCALCKKPTVHIDFSTEEFSRWKCIKCGEYRPRD